MSESEARPLNIVCLATYFKGGDFIRECKRLGCSVILITKEKMLQEDWPRNSLDDLIAVPNDSGPAHPPGRAGPHDAGRSRAGRGASPGCGPP